MLKLIDDFILAVCAGKTNETPQSYRSKLKHLYKFMNGSTAINQEDIDRFKIYLLERKTKCRGGKIVEEPLSRFTIRTVLQTTRHFLNWCAAQGHLPPLILKNIEEPEPDPKAVDPNTVDRMLKTASEHGEPWEQARNIALLYTLRDTGGRSGSLAKMELEHIDWKRQFALVPDKGDKTSMLLFNDATIAALREWTRYRDDLEPTGYHVFIGIEGQPLGRSGIYRIVKGLARVGKIKARHNPHSFRHAFARDALLDGADLGQVSKLLNHRGIVVTHKYYLRWSQMELRRFHRRYSPGRKLPRPTSPGTAMT